VSRLAAGSLHPILPDPAQPVPARANGRLGWRRVSLLESPLATLIDPGMHPCSNQKSLTNGERVPRARAREAPLIVFPLRLRVCGTHTEG
jgi:hypothetical protein